MSERTSDERERECVCAQSLSSPPQRRDYRVLARFLPPKQEFVLFIRLSSVQEGLYTHYLSKSSDKHSASDLFSTFSNLQKVQPVCVCVCVCANFSDCSEMQANNLCLSAHTYVAEYRQL